MVRAESTNERGGAPDPLEELAYSVPEVARILGRPPSTIRWWVSGRGEHEPVIEIADPEGRLLSFRNLIELHVLTSIRGKRVSLQKVRTALRFLRDRLGVEHPLAHQRFLTDGRELLIEHLNRLVEVSRPGQLVSKELLEKHLERIEYGSDGRAARLYPFLLRGGEQDPRAVVVDPKIQFGRPCLTGTGIPTEVVAERFYAGESVEELVADYSRSRQEIEAALRFESRRDAA
jgi:uncharacterized protein (DUF433 family)